MPFNGYVVDVMRGEDGTVYLRQNVKEEIKMVGIVDEELPCLRHSLSEHEAEQYMSGYCVALNQIISRLREKGILKENEVTKVKLRGNNNHAFLFPKISDYIEIVRDYSISIDDIKVPPRKPGMLEDIIGIADYNLVAQDRRRRLENARAYTKEDIAGAINPRESEIKATMEQMTDSERKNQDEIDELPF